MAKYLVIVESPAKVKTVKKYLGANYEVAASMGHVRDLPKSRLGIDVEHDFEPKYITIRGKGELLASLRKAAKKADKVYLATDPDREGEAISWHLSIALNLDENKMRRITFNEITKSAVKASIKQARDIDMNLVDEQQARRCLDRMVGYEISPLLWKKIKRGLSAGRVQSVALRIIGDREDEINAFIPKEYWTLEADLKIPGEKKPLVAKFHGKGSEKMAVETKEQLDEILKGLENETFTVSEVKKGERSKKAPLPFTTSTLQQEASKVLNFSTQKTMRLAQQLYEGVEVKGKGTIALISYLRTDSTRISEEADAAARSFIQEQYGTKYTASGDTTENKNSKAQDAHEAIRPTDVTNTPVMVKESLPRDLFRLYQLIWKRFVASRMQPAVYETISARINAGEYLFTAASSRLAFDGFMSVYTDPDEEKKEKNFWSEVYQNLGAAYVQMFQFHKSYKAYNTAFKLNEDPRILEKIYLLTCFTSGLSVDESYESLFKPELKEEWKQKLAQAELTAGQAEGLKTLRAMWKQDPAGQLERAGRLVGKWKDEYRVTQG